MRVTVVGCSPAWPNPGGAHSGYLVEHDGRRLLVDCGPGVLAKLREREPWPSVEAIVVSHFHLDHSGDLVPWLWGQRMGPGKDAPRPELWLAPEGRDWFESFADDIAAEFTVRDYAERARFDVAGVSVTPFRVPHYTQPTWALRLEAGGRVLAYSADSGPTPVLAEVARDADLFLCEATLAGEDGALRGHLSADEAIAAAAEARAKRLVLVHRPVELSAPPGVEVAHDGLVLDV